jgi:hypothetical protein
MKAVFVESICEDDDFHLLQTMLIENPKAGDVILTTQIWLASLQQYFFTGTGLNIKTRAEVPARIIR